MQKDANARQEIGAAVEPGIHADLRDQVVSRSRNARRHAASIAVWLAEDAKTAIGPPLKQASGLAGFQAGIER